MRLCQGMPPSSRVLLRDSFRSFRETSDAGGIVVASTIAGAGTPGISPTGASGRVTYNRSEALLINATQATIVCRFRLGTSPVGEKMVVSKANLGGSQSQFSLRLAGGYNIFYVAAFVGENATYMATGAGLTPNSEHVFHVVYDGGLAAASRGKWYVAGLQVAAPIAGTFPTRMVSSPIPVTVFNLFGGTIEGLPTDFILREFRIHDRAFSAEECADDYNNRTYQELQ